MRRKWMSLEAVDTMRGDAGDTRVVTEPDVDNSYRSKWRGKMMSLILRRSRQAKQYALQGERAKALEVARGARDSFEALRKQYPEILHQYVNQGFVPGMTVTRLSYSEKDITVITRISASGAIFGRRIYADGQITKEGRKVACKPNKGGRTWDEDGVDLSVTKDVAKTWPESAMRRIKKKDAARARTKARFK